MCRKIKHYQHGTAFRQIDALRKTKKGKNSLLGIYFCEDCKAYHVTSHPGSDCLVIV